MTKNYRNICFFIYFINISIYLFFLLIFFIWANIAIFSSFMIYSLKLLISFSIFHFFFNSFRYSNNLIIRMIQKSVLYLLCFYLSIFLISFISIKIPLVSVLYCQPTDDSPTTSIVETVINGVVQIYKDIGIEGKAISVGGAVASTLLKTMPYATLGAKVAGTTAVSAGVTEGVLVVAPLGKNIAANANIQESVGKAIENHPYADPSSDRIPSPDPFMVNSPLENQIPLNNLLEALEILNATEIYLIITIISILFSKNFNFVFIKVLSLLNNRIIPEKYSAKINIFIKKSSDTNKKISNTLIALLLIILLILTIINLYVSFELFNNIDSYVSVYNFLKRMN